MAINPVDTLRTVWQAGNNVTASLKPGQSLARHLYAGSLGNGARQFFTWFCYAYTVKVSTDVMKSTTNVDPHSITGIFLRSYPQSFGLTTSVYLFERLKNELQYHPSLREKAMENRSYRYFTAFKHVIQTQGWRGMARGFYPKVLSNAVLIFGANILFEQGRKRRMNYG